MGLQPFNGHEIAIEVTATEVIPAYAIVKFNASDKTKVDLATAGDIPLGVAIPHPDEMMPDGNGGLIKRTGYQIGERVTIYDSGTVFVKCGVANVTAGDKCVPMAGGLGAKLATDTFTDAAIATHDDAKINAAINGLIDEVQAAATAKDTVLGKYLVTGVITDLIPVRIKI
ncbi:hypothetical protein [Methanobacterium spitsbergense]|uniref:Uncharacterized protein n=1 Tax=Methanobacterium spitsbergense TaxID=2874285 RepID=A0A8T5V1S4_9EURY|nr:hypothetical protein [Methanobacterium spitsbergense]MBZ2167003.1 hypothetical protein [Methanobacterium spitsbergense]